jgi:hypothetical protein
MDLKPCWLNNWNISPNDRAFFCEKHRKGSIFCEKMLSKTRDSFLKGLSDYAMVTVEKQRGSG